MQYSNSIDVAHACGQIQALSCLVHPCRCKRILKHKFCRSKYMYIYPMKHGEISKPYIYSRMCSSSCPCSSSIIARAILKAEALKASTWMPMPPAPVRAPLAFRRKELAAEGFASRGSMFQSLKGSIVSIHKGLGAASRRGTSEVVRWMSVQCGRGIYARIASGQKCISWDPKVSSRGRACSTG